MTSAESRSISTACARDSVLPAIENYGERVIIVFTSQKKGEKYHRSFVNVSVRVLPEFTPVFLASIPKQSF